MFTVTISDKAGQSSRLEFYKNEISIGRMKGNDIVLPKGNVSKRHASIYLRESSFFVNDHGSTNGTYINGRKVSAEQLVAGDDKIYIGDFILQLERLAEGAPPDIPGPGRGTLPPVPNGGDGVERNRPGADTLFDPFGDSGPMNDPLRSTYTTPPPTGPDMARGGVPDGIRDTIGAFDEPGLGPAPRKYDAVPYTPSTPQPPIPTPAPPAPTAAPIPTAPVRPTNDTPPPSVSMRPSQPPAPEHPTPTPAPAPFPAPAPVPIPAPPAQDPAPSFGSGPSPIVKPPTPTAQPTGPAPKAPSIKEEFDSDFFVAQIDVARVIFESNPLNELPLDYPVEEDTKRHYEQAVDRAIQEINPSVDKERLREILIAETTELGVIDHYLNDYDVRDIYINRYDQILVRRNGELVQGRYVFSNPDILEFVAKRLLGGDMDGIGADEIRFSDGTRVHVVMPPLAVDGPLITIRKPPVDHPSLQDLVDQGALSMGMADFLMRAIDAGRSIAIAGPTSSGKTTMLSSLAALIYEGMRIISIEDYAHIELPQGSSVRLEANPASGFDKRFLLRQALSMHPQRILLDECRGSEAYDWVTAVAAGTEGSMLTIHGSNASDALGRLESLCLLGSHEISPRGIREQIARAVDLVVVVNRVDEAAFRVQQITEVQGVDLDTFRLNDIFYYRVDSSSGAFHPTGYIPLFYEDLRHAGLNVDFDIFRE